MSPTKELEKSGSSWFIKALPEACKDNFSDEPSENRPSLSLGEIMTNFTKLSFEPLLLQDTTSFEKMSRAEPGSSADQGSCANCGENARKWCKKCKGTPSVAGIRNVTTYYCTSCCQAAHWKEHKSACLTASTRNMIYRAASIAQQLCFIYQKAAFYWGFIDKLEKKTLFIWHVHMKHRPSGKLAVPFPKDLIPDSCDQEAILAHRACNSAVAVMAPIIDIMLKGIGCKIEEVLVETKNRRLLILVIEHDDFKFGDLIAPFHRLFRITLLKNGEEFAIDLTGSQFGHAEFVLPWKQFMQLRAERLIQVSDNGETKSWLDEQRSEERNAWENNHSSCLIGHIAIWSQGNHLSLADLLKLPDTEYDAGKRRLLKEVEEGAEKYKDWLLEELASEGW